MAHRYFTYLLYFRFLLNFDVSGFGRFRDFCIVLLGLVSGDYFLFLAFGRLDADFDSLLVATFGFSMSISFRFTASASPDFDDDLKRV